MGYNHRMKTLIPAAYVALYIQLLNLTDDEIDNMLDYYEYVNNYPFTGVYDA